MARMTDRSPLAQLVDEVCDANGWSRREVARRAQAAGRSISHTRIGQLTAEYPLKGIQADKVDDLAAGLGVSRDRVALAVIQAMGFRVNDSTPSPAEAIRRDPSLPQATKDALLAILRAAPTRRAGGGEHGQRSAPMTQEPSGARLKTPPTVDSVRARLQEHLAEATSQDRREELMRMLADLDQLQEVAQSATGPAASESA